MAGESEGRHRAEAGERMPWRARPRARLQGGLHRLYVLALLVVVGLLWAGASAVVAGPSSLSRLGGVLVFLCGAALVWLVILYLRRPVED